MTDTQQFREDLQYLCDNKYSKKHVKNAFGYLCVESRKILQSKGWLNSQIFCTGDDSKKLLDDYALDFIAHLFARDNIGRFYLIEKYFTHILDEPDHHFNSVVNSLIRSFVYSGVINVYQDRDPVAKAFYKSLHYILKNNPGWRKKNIGASGPTLFLSNSVYVKADMIDVEQAFLGANQTALSSKLQEVLEKLIEEKQLSVPTHLIISYLKKQVEVDHPDPTENEINPELIVTTHYAILQCIKVVDNNILSKYVTKGKLKKEEKKYFISALTNMQKDTVYYGKVDGYCNYLSDSLPKAITVKEYQKRYRIQFEYAAIEMKKTFSAIMKNEGI